MKKPGNEFKWVSEFHKGVTIQQNKWYSHENKEGGGPVWFLMSFDNMSYQEAMNTLLDDGFKEIGGDKKTEISQENKIEKREFIPPERKKSMRNTFAYLIKTRGIHADILQIFIKANKIYECEYIPKQSEKKYSNVVFTFKEALSKCEDKILTISMYLAFACSMRYGEISGLQWENVIIDDKSIAENNARIFIDKELARISIKALQKLKDKDIIFKFPVLRPNVSTRLVLKTPKTESSTREVWLPKSLALLLREYKQEQEELKNLMGDIYTDYDLVLAFDTGMPIESANMRRKWRHLIKVNNFKEVVFHSLRHLSTGYKLKLTKGDIKSVQGDTGHAEPDMVMSVYTRIIDEDRKLNATKLDSDFYGSIGEKGIDNECALTDDEKLLDIFNSASQELKNKLLLSLIKAS